jgi:predicted NUDIX family phosphoesterase
MMSTEQVLVFPAKTLKEIGKFQGFEEQGKIYLDKIFEKNNTIFLDREIAEKDSSYKQLIPYIVLASSEGIFTYKRSQKSGEEKLRGKWSLGIGGHINDTDYKEIDQNHSGIATYVEGLYRELEEELEILTGFDDRILGAIYDETTEVGRVHFGIVHLFVLNEPRVKIKDETISDAVFLNLGTLVQYKDSFENWSQFVIDYLSSKEAQYYVDITKESQSLQSTEKSK